ncbi:MAG: PEP-CTERM sorting domain-containing protein [Planctomycetes bacterium]|nr:PEP-CTERM sorting domain-containing protein [Planctomycetota bacterium]
MRIVIPMVSVVVFSTCLTFSAHGDPLLDDDFTAFDPVSGGVWQGATGLSQSPYTYEGLPQVQEVTTLDGRSVLHVQSTLSVNAFRGYQTVQSWPLSTAHVELDVQPMLGSDHFVELWLVDASLQNGFGFSIHKNSFNPDTERLVNFHDLTSGVRTSPASSTGPIWDMNQWYRVVMDGSATSFSVSFKDGMGAELWSHAVPYGLAQKGSEFKLCLIQLRGSGETEIGAAFDRIVMTPEPAGLLLLVLGGLAAVRRRRTIG